MITPIVIEDGRKRFQYMVSSFEDNSFSKEKFGLLNVEETTSFVGEGTLIISENIEPLVKYGDYWETTIFSGYEGPENVGDVHYVDDEDNLVDVLYLEGTDETHELYIEDENTDSEEVTSGGKGSGGGYGNGGIIPGDARKTTIEIYVPDYSPSTYGRLEYIVDVSTRIGMTKIILACKKFNFDDLLSIEKPYRDGQHKYHQYFSFNILDPWEICYGDDFETFRDEYCGETPETNSCGAIVDIEITAVNTSSAGDGSYIPDTRYTTGRNMILLSERDSDYMSINLTSATDGWITKLEFNSAFDGDLKEYMRETYFLDVEECIPEIVIMDKENIYKIYDLESAGDGETIFHFYDSVPELRFDDWSEYLDGMYAVSSLRMFSSDGDEIMDLKSNIVPIDKVKFSFIVGEKIDILEEMNIVENKLDIVNKINKTVIKVDRPDDYKSNIIRPVFYRSFPLDSIEIHNSVTFTISIDLDSYKTKSDSFSIQIEGMNFPEVGRVPGGVLFKITGSELPAKETTGKYYILDEYQELVAEGNYIYV